MRLIDRSDTSLAIALVASALVVFQRPLRLLLDAAHLIELRYDIDLLPGLCVLVGTFVFHEYTKRQHARAAATAASREAALAQARSTELERLVTFGRALGSALDTSAARQVFWRFMPGFAGDRAFWMLTRRHDGWDSPVYDATRLERWTVDALEATAVRALSGMAANSGREVDGIVIDGDFCVPLVVGEHAVGVLGVRNHPPMAESERSALGAAAALLAIAIRNAQLIAQTRESSVRDGLTGCFNRAYALEALKAEIQRARRTRRPLSVLMFDVDEFKAINDRHGHLAGDAVLAAIGARLASMLRATDVKCRYGGDEFIVILPDTVLSGAEHVASTLLDTLSTLRVSVGATVLSTTISIGVTMLQPGETEPSTVIGRADAALYRAKRSGRNQFATVELAAAG